MSTTVNNAMSRNIATLGPQSTLQNALNCLLQEQVEAVYIVDDHGYLLGLVPDYELLKVQLAGMHPQTGVERLINRDVKTTAPSTPLAEVAPLFRQSCHHRLAVVQEGRLVGQLTRRDVLQFQARQKTPCAEMQAQDEATAAPKPKFAQKRIRSAHT